jgi:hypothetical protein
LNSGGRRPRGEVIGQAWTLLRAGREHDAADLFGRLLLQDPDCAEARRGLSDARAAAAERARRLDAGLDQARRAAHGGDPDSARALLEHIVDEGGDRDRARAALDKLDVRAGRLEQDPALESVAAPSPRRTLPAPHAPLWARRALAAGCAAAFALLAAGVDARWDGLIRVLERTPRPQSAATPAALPMAPLSPGEQALVEARRMMDQGDTAGALRALDAVPPEEPAYPFARQLRTQAESALHAGRAR